MADDIPKQDGGKEEVNPVLALLEEALDYNGHTPSAKRDRALFTVLKAIYLEVAPLSKRIKVLEDKSIVIWMEKHKALSATIITVLAFIGMAFHDLYPYIIGFLKLWEPLK